MQEEKVREKLGDCEKKTNKGQGISSLLETGHLEPGNGPFWPSQSK